VFSTHPVGLQPWFTRKCQLLCQSLLVMQVAVLVCYMHINVDCHFVIRSCKSKSVKSQVDLNNLSCWQTRCSKNVQWFASLFAYSYYNLYAQSCHVVEFIYSVDEKCRMKMQIIRPISVGLGPTGTCSTCSLNCRQLNEPINWIASAYVWC